jgi:hypothetical protein
MRCLLHESMKLLLFTAASLLPLSAATIVSQIDNFSVGMQVVDLSGTTGTATDTFTDISGNVIGGERILSLSVLSNPLAQTAKAAVGVGGQNVMTLDLGVLVSATATLVYGGNGSAGLGGVNLTAGGANAIAIIVTSLLNPSGLLVSVTDTSNQTATLSVTSPGNILSPETLTFPYADFTNGTSTDFGMIDRIEFGFQPNLGEDLILGFVGTAQVPEPHASLFLIFGALSLCLNQRRK